MTKHFARKYVALVGLAALLALAIVDAPKAVAKTFESADQLNYVLFAPNSDSTSMSGSMDDIRRARAYRNGKEALLYVRQNGNAYVIRDAALLREARALFKPQEELGERQGELGRRQGELGKKQAALGAEQARLGALQANARPSEAGQLARRQGELGRRQGELGAQQGELGRQQGELGAEQGRLAQIAHGKLRGLIAEAIRRGLAQRVS